MSTYSPIATVLFFPLFVVIVIALALALSSAAFADRLMADKAILGYQQGRRRFSILLTYGGLRLGHALVLPICVIAMLTCWNSGAMGAKAGDPLLEVGLPRGLPLDTAGNEKYNAGWTFAIDNDLLASGGRDFDYTGGFALTFAGRRTAEWFWSVDPLVGWMELLFFRDRNQDPFVLHSQQIGLLAFAPDDLNNPDPIFDDRPYASLIFLANSRTRIRGPLDPVDTTTVTVGVLGMPAAGSIQRFIHEERDLSEIPQGWEHQISDGGELTARVAWARQSLLDSNFQLGTKEYELKWERELSLGYQTEVTFSLSGRWGRLNTPWWSFTPDRAEYVSQPAPVIGTAFRHNIRELYIWAGIIFSRDL